MKLFKFNNKEEWLLARRGKITGTRLKNIIVKRGNGKKIGFYELIAERVAVIPDGQNPMDRGVELEPQAIERFVKETGKKVDTSLVIIARDDNENIAYSPDAFIGKQATESLEVKCLSSAHHIEAWLTQEVPDEYKDQTIQPFCANDKLKTLYVAFYDPRIPSKDFFYLTIKRKDIEEKVKEYLEYQRNILKEVEVEVLKLTF